jgi:hypothetical protein
MTAIGGKKCSKTAVTGSVAWEAQHLSVSKTSLTAIENNPCLQMPKDILGKLSVFCVYVSRSCVIIPVTILNCVTVSVTVTDDLLNTKVFSPVSRLLKNAGLCGSQ